MKKQEQKSFIARDPNGNKIRCDILFTFKNENNDREYVVYTDNSRDAKGETNVFASVKSLCEDGIFKLDAVEDDEWPLIETAFEEYSTNKHANQNI